MNISTIIIVATIVLVVLLFAFVYYILQASRLSGMHAVLAEQLRSTDSPLDRLRGTDAEPLAAEYRRSLTLKTKDGEKTELAADKVFNSRRMAELLRLNLPGLENGGRVLSGLGLAGMFVTLAVALGNYTGDSLRPILDLVCLSCINALIGIGLGVIHNVLFHRWFNLASTDLCRIAERLDALYYANETAIRRYNILEAAESLGARIDRVAAVAGNTQSQLAATTQTLIQTMREQRPDQRVQFPVEQFEQMFSRIDKSLNQLSTQLSHDLSGTTGSLLSPIVNAFGNSMTQMKAEVQAMTAGTAAAVNEMAQAFGATTEQLTEYTRNLTGGSTTVINRIMERLESSMAEMMKRIETLNQEALTGMNPLIEQLETTLTRVTNDTQTLSTRQAEALHLLMTRFEEAMAQQLRGHELYTKSAATTINDLLGRFADALARVTETAENSVSSTGDNIELITKQFNNALVSLASESQTLAATTTERIADMADNLSRSAEAITNLPQTIAETTANLRQAMQTEQQAMTEAAQTAVSQATEAVGRLSREVGDRQTGLAKQYTDSMHQTNSLLDQVNKCMQAINKSNDNIRSTLETFGINRRELGEMTVRMAGVSNTLLKTSDAFADRMEAIKEVQVNDRAVLDGLFDLAKVVFEGASHYNQQFENVNRAIAAMLEAMRQDLAKTNPELLSDIIRVAKGMPRKIDGRAEASISLRTAHAQKQKSRLI